MAALRVVPQLRQPARALYTAPCTSDHVQGPGCHKGGGRRSAEGGRQRAAAAAPAEQRSRRHRMAGAANGTASGTEKWKEMWGAQMMQLAAAGRDVQGAVGGSCSTLRVDAPTTRRCTLQTTGAAAHAQRPSSRARKVRGGGRGGGARYTGWRRNCCHGPHKNILGGHRPTHPLSMVRLPSPDTNKALPALPATLAASASRAGAGAGGLQLGAHRWLRPAGCGQRGWRFGGGCEPRLRCQVHAGAELARGFGAGIPAAGAAVVARGCRERGGCFRVLALQVPPAPRGEGVRGRAVWGDSLLAGVVVGAQLAAAAPRAAGWLTFCTPRPTSGQA